MNLCFIEVKRPGRMNRRPQPVAGRYQPRNQPSSRRYHPGKRAEMKFRSPYNFGRGGSTKRGQQAAAKIPKSAYRKTGFAKTAFGLPLAPKTGFAKSAVGVPLAPKGKQTIVADTASAVHGNHER